MTKNNNIVFLRFLAIVIVVFGHSIIIYDPNWGIYKSQISAPILVFVKHFINFFQMPLFIAISGFLLAYCKKDYVTFIVSKIKRLIIPFILVGIFYLIPIRYAVGYSGYINNNLLYNIFHNLIFGYDSGHLWFLPTLFIIFVITGFIVNMRKYRKILEIALFIIGIILMEVNKLVIFHPYVSNVCQLLGYFMLGYFISKYSIDNRNHTIFYTILVLITIVFNIIDFIIYVPIIHDYSRIFIIMLFLSLLFNLPWEKVFKFNMLNKIVNVISENSFGIYLFHSPLIYFTFKYLPNINPILMIIINFLLLGCLALFINIIITKIKKKL